MVSINNVIKEHIWFFSLYEKRKNGNWLLFVNVYLLYILSLPTFAGLEGCMEETQEKCEKMQR